MAFTGDIKIAWDRNYQEGDFNFLTDTQDLESDSSLETAVMISLFTDGRAKEDDILPDPNSLDRRGWWGNLVSDIKGDKEGSRLWLLNREKTTESVLVRAKQYVEESLQWMIEDKVASKIEVEVERQGVVGNDVLAIGIEIYKIDGNKETFNFELQWMAQALK